MALAPVAARALHLAGRPPDPQQVALPRAERAHLEEPVTRPPRDPEVERVFGPPVGPDCDPEWPPPRDTDVLPDIGDYQEEPHDLRPMRPSR